MKKHILIIISCLLINTSFAQNPNFEITCPENTFLGIFDCNNVADLPFQPVNLAEAMASPYNIIIEGDLSANNLRVATEDDAVIFYCESDSRLVNRKVIIYEDLNFNFIWDVGEEVGSCSYTVETIPDLSPPQFTAPPDIELACGTNTYPNNAGYVSLVEDVGCTVIIDGVAVSFADTETIEEGIRTIIRSWVAVDACGNTSETQLQTITINCSSENNYTITCPDNTFLGTFDCTNIADVPDLPGNLEEAMASPYNLLIEGDLSTDNLRVHSNDDATIFYCEIDNRLVNRTITIYIDENFNFAYDFGEEVGNCNYTIETIADLTPPQLIAVPPDIEIACGIEPIPRNTGDFIQGKDNDCNIIHSPRESFEDQITEDGGITTIIRSWVLFDPCGNASETQQQTITINCTPVCNLIPPKITCGN